MGKSLALFEPKSVTSVKLKNHLLPFFLLKHDTSDIPLQLGTTLEAQL